MIWRKTCSYWISLFGNATGCHSLWNEPRKEIWFLPTTVTNLKIIKWKWKNKWRGLSSSHQIAQETRYVYHAAQHRGLKIWWPVQTGRLMLKFRQAVCSRGPEGSERVWDRWPEIDFSSPRFPSVFPPLLVPTFRGQQSRAAGGGRLVQTHVDTFLSSDGVFWAALHLWEFGESFSPRVFGDAMGGRLGLALETNEAHKTAEITEKCG